jgi:hypothetical protein
MRRASAALALGAAALSVVLQAAQPAAAPGDLAAVLARVGESVSRYYARAHSIICTETVRIQPLGHDLSGDGTPPRRLEYELRVSWDTAADRGTPDATVQRQLLKVNGRTPRPEDEPGCMDPKPVSPEPLAMLLPDAQADYLFTVAGRRRMDGRATVLLDYRSREAGPAKALWTKDCFSIEMPGRTRGRVWIDAETHDVLRLDEHLTGMFDVNLPPEHRRMDRPTSMTIERADSSIVYRPVAFEDPEESVMLPASITTVHVVRNAGVPRVRTMQVFSNYRRFMTAGRIVR